MSAYPVIYHTGTIADFILHILADHGNPNLIIVCMSREEFLHKLLISLEHTSQPKRTSQNEAGDNMETDVMAEEHGIGPEQSLAINEQQTHPLLIPTLRLLSASRTTRLVFLSSVPALHAYLSTITSASTQSNQSDTMAGNNSTQASTLALLNVVALHRHTAAFSAQGLGRAFAAAVEAGWYAGMRVVVYEQHAELGRAGDAGDVNGRGGHYDDAMEDEDSDGAARRVSSILPVVGTETDVGMTQRRANSADRRDTGMEAEETALQSGGHDIWDDEVPILNAATKTFGVAGERRGWLGRTVRLRDVAGRWFAFEELPMQKVF